MRWCLFSNPAIILLIVPAEIAAPFAAACRGRSGDRHDAAKTPRRARCSDVSLIPGHARTLPLPRSRSEHTRTGGLQLGAMPLPISSSIAFLFLGRCDSPMPRSTFGALVNWTFS